MGKNYLFPYEKVSAHSTVVIYAYGRVGMCYANQLYENHYCEIAAIIDQNYQNKTCRGFRLCGLDYLRENTGYDYLIIALEDAQTRNDVYRMLIELGVEQRKIINAGPAETACKCMEELCPDLSNLLNAVSGVELSSDFRFDHYIYLINDVIVLRERSPRLLEEVKARLADSKIPEEKIVLLQLLYAAGVFDAELLRVYLHTIMELEDVEWKLHFFRLSTLMIFFKQECLYDDFYLERREIMKALAGDLGLSIPMRAAPRDTAGRKKRIAILTLCLIDNQVGAHFLTIGYANLLQAHGYEVAVFSDEKCSDLSYVDCPCGKKALIPTFFTVHAEAYNSRNKRYYDPNVRLVYTDSFSRAACAYRTARKIEEFDPDCIIDLSDELSVLPAALYGRWPIFAIPLRGYTSSSYFDKFLARDREQCLRINRKYRAMREEQMDFHNVVQPLPVSEQVYRREDHGLWESDFVLTTVGNRLATEMTADFIDSVCALLRSHSDMRWILVGESLPGYLDSACQDLLSNGQILKWGYEKDLMALYRMCDVFVNPDRVGSGTAIAMAMYCGVPLAATNRVASDLWSYYSQFSTAGNYTEMAGYVMKLKEDKTFYRDVSDKSILAIKDGLTGLRGEGFVSAIEKAFISAVEDLIAHWRLN